MQSKPLKDLQIIKSKKNITDGKQKRHTLKSQFIVLPKAEELIDVVIGQPGPTSDIKICRQTLSKFDSQQTFSGDKAYIGENQITTPHS